MSNFKDFDLDLKEIKTNNQSEGMASFPSSDCSLSDMTACGYCAEPGKNNRC
ncbi:hypothetical protein KQI86_05240 [Clostridium sp. MSJ-11]|uniref:Lantibiotic n=1 Tax=Clostridium mobile TaxID=2841512 RepID=A0ABS6EET1_9CLOT|nr:hypothetical protein [Clostridium mobile]MBU5483726.1 hypothetical protein [Clostridium mobile]